MFGRSQENSTKLLSEVVDLRDFLIWTYEHMNLKSFSEIMETIAKKVLSR